MADCRHEWKPRANGTKEDCQLCGAARVIYESRCNHEWVARANGKKEGCSKCGAARIILNVEDVQKSQEAESPL